MTSGLIEVEEATRRLLEALPVLPAERVALRDALGRVLAEEVAADRDSPATDRSAMDGFAVRAGDVREAGAGLRIVGEIRAGASSDGTSVGAGQAVRVFTGAPIPSGADAVVMVERTEEDRAAGLLRVLEAPAIGQHIRKRAEDRVRGDVVLDAGSVIGSAEIAALATVGRRFVQAIRRPRVAVLSTGDEVVPVDAVPLPHQVRNSNAHGLLAQLAEIGVPGEDLGVAPDEPQALGSAVRAGLAADALLITGGVSVGDYDHVGASLRREGCEVLFHGVAMRPGKPVLAARAGGRLVLGIPGNPVSAFTAFAVFGVPAIRKMAGHPRPDSPRVRVTLTEPLRRTPGLAMFHLARVEIVDGRYRGRAVASTGSGDVLSLVRANAFLETPGGSTSVDSGEEVFARLWRGSGLR